MEEWILIDHPLGGELVHSRRNTVVVVALCWTFWCEGVGSVELLEEIVF